MKLVKEHINEKFTQDSDPIRDLGIGIKEITCPSCRGAIYTNFLDHGEPDYDSRCTLCNGTGKIDPTKLNRFQKWWYKDELNEKFTQDSDPIKDMGIGSVISCQIGDHLKIKQKFPHVYLTYIKDSVYHFSYKNKCTWAWLFPDNLICVVENIERYEKQMSLKIKLMTDNFSAIYNTIFIIDDYKLFLKYFEKVK